MYEDTIADLKQFITTTMSQQLALQTGELKKEIRDELREDLGSRIDKLEEKIDDVDTKLNTIANTVGAVLDDDREQIADHEKRITRLEHKAA